MWTKLHFRNIYNNSHAPVEDQFAYPALQPGLLVFHHHGNILFTSPVVSRNRKRNVLPGPVDIVILCYFHMDSFASGNKPKTSGSAVLQENTRILRQRTTTIYTKENFCEKTEKNWKEKNPRPRINSPKNYCEKHRRRCIWGKMHKNFVENTKCVLYALTNS